MVLRLRLACLAAFFALTSVGFAAAQSETCGPPVFSPEASTACAGIGPDQACYGSPEVLAVFSDAAQVFETPGDIVDLSAVESLALSAPIGAETPALAYLRLAGEDGADVYLVLYGEVAFVPDDSGGYRIESGASDSDCIAPAGGLLVYSTGAASLTLNGVVLDFGAGMIHLATSGNGLAITVVDGSVEAASGESSVTLGADQTATVPPDEDGVPSEPSEPAEADALSGFGDLFAALSPLSASTHGNFLSFSAPTAEIVPTAGLWDLESYYISPVPVCPDGGYVEGAERQPPQSPRAVEFDFSDGVSLESFVQQLTGAVPAARYDHPAPNLYTALSPTNIEVSLYVMSATEMIFITVYSQVNCSVQTVNWWVLTE